MAGARQEDLETPPRNPLPDLVAPRRVFKRKRNKGLILALKIVLPLIAVGCVAYIVIWSRDVKIVPIEVVADAKQQSATDVMVQQVKYDGVDANNRPFSITAESATQPHAEQPVSAPVATTDEDGNPLKKTAAAPAQPSGDTKADSVINLKQLVADMTLTNGAWVAVTADDGIYHRDAGTVDLSGNVTLFHDTGLQFETDAATVDLKNDTARGDQPVEGQNADGLLAAQGFEVRNDGQTVVFTGRAYMKLFPKQTGGSGQ